MEGEKNRKRDPREAVRYDQYYLAEQTGWVLYVEDRTDLSILQAFADRLNHNVKNAISSPFLHPIGNQPNKGREHFKTLVEAKPDLQGFLLVDSDAPELRSRAELIESKWVRREIENYICQPETLISFARDFGRTNSSGPLFDADFISEAEDKMTTAVSDRVPPAAFRDRDDPWWSTVKASDDFLDLVFKDFSNALGLPLILRKSEYYLLVPHVPINFVSPEVTTVLDGILEVSMNARPVVELSVE